MDTDPGAVRRRVDSARDEHKNTGADAILTGHDERHRRVLVDRSSDIERLDDVAAGRTQLNGNERDVVDTRSGGLAHLINRGIERGEIAFSDFRINADFGCRSVGAVIDDRNSRGRYRNRKCDKACD